MLSRDLVDDVVVAAIVAAAALATSRAPHGLHTKVLLCTLANSGIVRQGKSSGTLMEARKQETQRL